MDDASLWAQQGGWPRTWNSLILLIRLLYCSLTLAEDTLHSFSLVLLLLVVLAGWEHIVVHGHFLLEGRREMQSAIQSWPLCSSADELCRVDNGLNYLSPLHLPPSLPSSSLLIVVSSFVLQQRYTDAGWRPRSLAAFHRSNFSN